MYKRIHFFTALLGKSEENTTEPEKAESETATAKENQTVKYYFPAETTTESLVEAEISSVGESTPGQEIPEEELAYEDIEGSGEVPEGNPEENGGIAEDSDPGGDGGYPEGHPEGGGGNPESYPGGDGTHPETYPEGVERIRKLTLRGVVRIQNKISQNQSQASQKMKHLSMKQIKEQMITLNQMKQVRTIAQLQMTPNLWKNQQVRFAKDFNIWVIIDTKVSHIIVY